MDSISSNVDAEVTSVGCRIRIKWLGGSEHFSTSFDNILSFPNHAAHWARSGIRNESFKETFVGQISVMLREHSSSRLAEFHSNQFEAFLLKSGNDLAYLSSLDTIRLNHDKGSFSFGHLFFGINFWISLHVSNSKVIILFLTSLIEINLKLRIILGGERVIDKAVVCRVI